MTPALTPQPGAGGEPEVRVLADAESASRAAAEAIAAALGAAIERRGRADWATTGGSTPAGVYGHLAVDPLRETVDWGRVHVWWGDDRFVPRDHPLSNVLPLDQALLSAAGRAGQSGSGADAAMPERGLAPGVWIPPANLHAPPMTEAIGEGAGVEWVAERYAAELQAAGLARGEGGYPAFDVLFLGVGPDGHILSVFPGSTLLDSAAWAAAVPAPGHVEPHVERLSLNPAVVAAARLPIVVAHGGGKAEILSAVFGAERDPRRWPAQLARREGAVWFLDRAAAAQLPSTVATSPA